MEVTVNGESRTIRTGSTVGELLREVEAPSRGSAVAVDGVVVPRSDWNDRVLDAGAHVELVTAVQGG